MDSYSGTIAEGECDKQRRMPIAIRIGIAALIAISAVIVVTGAGTEHVLSTEPVSTFSAEKFKTAPNIIFVLADDLGWNSIGYEDFDLSFVTPTLTSLAQSGIIMATYYGQELCTPSRASLLTGRYPLSIGMQYNIVQPAVAWGLNLEETTIAEVLQDAGYKTHAIGKWHLGSHSPRFLPTARGFDSWIGYTQGANYYWSKREPAMTTFIDFLSTDRDCYYAYDGSDMTNYSTHLFRDLAVQLIENHDQAYPLFLYLPFQAVHDPYEDMTGRRLIPADFMRKEMYDKIQDDVKGDSRKEYAMALTILDEAVESIVSALDQTDMLGNSYIIFASDNGGCFYSGGKNGPLRGAKGTLYEGGTRVDSFVYSPLFDDAITGQSFNNLMHVSDWFPTILDMAAVEFTPSPGFELDGYSQLSSWTSGQVVRDYMLYNAYYNVSGFQFNVSLAIRDERYKLIHAYNSSTYATWYSYSEILEDDENFCVMCECGQTNSFDGEFVYGLYDLQDDPYEQQNLYDDDDMKSIKENLYVQLQLAKDNAAFEVGGRQDMAALNIWKAADNYMIPFVSPDTEVWPGIDKSYPSYCGRGVNLDDD